MKYVLKICSNLNAIKIFKPNIRTFISLFAILSLFLSVSNTVHASTHENVFLYVGESQTCTCPSNELPNSLYYNYSITAIAMEKTDEELKIDGAYKGVKFTCLKEYTGSKLVMVEYTIQYGPKGESMSQLKTVLVDYYVYSWGNRPDPESVTLNKKELNFTSVGSTERLTATVLPANATQTVTWKSSDTSIASVDMGTVTAVREGTCYITATTTNNKEDKCVVNVKLPDATSISLDKTDLCLTTFGATQQLIATISPSTASQAVTWKSSDTSIATVNNGLVTAGNKEGTAVILATTANGLYTAKCNVTVMIPAKREITLTEAGTLANFISDEEKYSIGELKVSGPINGTDIKLIRDMAGADINGNPTQGNLISLDLSKAEITEGGDTYYLDFAKTKNKIITQWMFCNTILENLEIPEKTDSIGDWALAFTKISTLSLPDGITGIGASAFAACQNLSYITIPSSVKYIGERALPEYYVKKITFAGSVPPTQLDFYSSFNDIYKRSSIVLKVPSGSKYAYTSHSQWGKFDNIEEYSPSSPVILYFDDDDITLTVGESIKVKARVTPEWATYSSKSYTSSNSSVITVDKEGNVTALKSGWASISATTNKGGHGACFFNVSSKPSGISIVSEDTEEPNKHVYNVYGQRINPSTAKGIMIINGRKILRR